VQARLAEVKARIAKGEVSVCRGGRRLANSATPSIVMRPR
jgi:hypothetical protein